MSYYDHATMMAHKLGPWADDPETEHDAIERARRGEANAAFGHAVRRVLQIYALNPKRPKRHIPSIDHKACAER